MFLPYFGGPEPLLLLLLAMVAELAVGDIRPVRYVLTAPATVTRRVTRALDRRLNRVHRSDSVRWWRGVLALVLMSVLAVAMGWIIAGLCRRMPLGWLVELALVTGALDLRGLWSRVRRVGVTLRARGVEAGRQALVGLSDQNVFGLDEHGIVRAGIEVLAWGAVRRIGAPGLWYGLFGLPGVLLWVVVDTMAAQIGHDTPHYARFGRPTAWAAAVLTTPPGVLAALLVAAGAAFTPGARPVAALRASWPLRGLRRSAVAPAVTAMAAALDVSLGGPRREGDQVRMVPWIGDGRARAQPADLDRALSLYGITAIIAAGVIAVGLVAAAAA